MSSSRLDVLGNMNGGLRASEAKRDDVIPRTLARMEMLSSFEQTMPDRHTIGSMVICAQHHDLMLSGII